MYQNRLKITFIVSILIFLSFGVSFASDFKIGLIDIQKAVNECNAGKEAKKIIAKEIERFQRQYGEKQKELQTMKENLDKQALMLTPEARAAKEKELQAKGRDFQRWIEDTQNEIKQKGMEMERNISLGLQKLIQKMGAEEGYTIILEKNENIVLFSSKAVDITDKVIKLYDLQKK